MKRSVLQEIFKELREIKFQMQHLEQGFNNAVSNAGVSRINLSDVTVLQLPDHLRKSYLAVSTLGETAAKQVSCETGRSRAVESNYLNQLVLSGWLSRRRVGKNVMFRCAVSVQSGPSFT